MGGAGVVKGSRMVAADVHAAGSWLAGLELATGEVWSRRVRGAPSRVAEVVAQLGPGARLIYEAGPTGFGLARAGAELGVDVVVCAPGSVPRAAGDRVKTDRRDAERLLRLWRSTGSTATTSRRQAWSWQRHVPYPGSVRASCRRGRPAPRLQRRNQGGNRGGRSTTDPLPRGRGSHPPARRPAA